MVQKFRQAKIFPSTNSSGSTWTDRRCIIILVQTILETRNQMCTCNNLNRSMGLSNRITEHATRRILDTLHHRVLSSTSKAASFPCQMVTAHFQLLYVRASKVLRLQCFITKRCFIHNAVVGYIRSAFSKRVFSSLHRTSTLVASQNRFLCKKPFRPASSSQAPQTPKLLVTCHCCIRLRQSLYPE